MPCPLFHPTEPLPWREWSGKLRPPLGRPYQGACGAGHEPTDPKLEVCNLGYPAGRCPGFPDEAADAVRLIVAADDGERVTLRWSVEKGCLPLETGEAVYERGAGDWIGRPVSETVAAQLQARLASHLDDDSEA